MLKIVIVTSCFYYLLIVLHKNYTLFINSRQYKNTKKNINKKHKHRIRQGQKYFLEIFKSLL